MIYEDLLILHYKTKNSKRIFINFINKEIVRVENITKIQNNLLRVNSQEIELILLENNFDEMINKNKHVKTVESIIMRIHNIYKIIKPFKVEHLEINRLNIIIDLEYQT
jgi:hypothetical protein